MELATVYQALTVLRAPLQRGEYDLHHLVMEALAGAGLPCVHEVSLAAGCRIDLLCGEIGIEIKRGKPNPARLLPQLTRYCALTEITGLILVCERSVRLPSTLNGKPVKALCLNHLWGIAL